MASQKYHSDDFPSPAPSSPNKNPIRLREVHPEDIPWLGYLGDLPPGDESGAFLLPDELPNPYSPPGEIQLAIRTAARRAFGITTSLYITDFVLGRIWGEMRVLLPQGRDVVYPFDGEKGWKATMITGDDPQTRVTNAYFRSACMNPVRLAVARGAEVDSSKVTFIPMNGDEIEEIQNPPWYIQMFDENQARLAYEYQALGHAGQLFSQRLTQIPSLPNAARPHARPSFGHRFQAWASAEPGTGSPIMEWLRNLLFPEPGDRR